jgi:tetratricopeptide (TPR) repeat protein
MGLRPSRSYALAPLLVLLAISAPAAAQTATERAFRDVRTAVERGDWLTADQKSQDALSKFGSLDDDSVWAIRALRGEILNGRGKYPEAREALNFQLPPRLAHSAIAVRRLLYLTSLGVRTRNTTLARTSLDEARALATKYQPSIMAEVFFLVQYVDAANAEATLAKAIRLAKKSGDTYTELRALNSVMRLQLGRGEWAAGIHSGERMLPRLRALHYDGLLQKTEGNLAWALREIGDEESAAVYLADAVAIATRFGAVADRIPWLTQLGNMAYEAGDYATAERYYRQSYELAKPLQHEDFGRIAANRAVIAISNDRFDEARQLNAEATAFKKKSGVVDAVLRSRLIDARIAERSGDHAEAKRILANVEAESKVPSTRWIAAAQLANVYVSEKRYAEASAQFVQALATVNEARAGIEDAELRISFNRASRDIVNDYVDFLVDTGDAEDALLVTEAVRAQTLEEALGASKEKADPRSIAKQIGASILCYHLGPRHSYVWSVTPDAVRVAPLPSRTIIRAAVDAYVRDLIGPLGANESRGMALYRMLIEPSTIRGGPVVVIADERLNVLNLEALFVPGPRPHYWIEDVVLRSAPSLQILGRATQARKRTDSLLLIGNAPQADPIYPPLRSAGVEVDNVRKRFPRPVVFDGAKATPDAYRNAGPESFDVIHFVAHGEATMTKPLESAVILGRDATGYKLLASDIIKQPITARLVTISSCYGAGKRTYVGEGLVGLAWAFLHAGAQQVIAAVWDVNDAATPTLMDTMYERIRTGRDPVTALRDAKLKLIGLKGTYAKPKYWAPFVIYSGM